MTERDPRTLTLNCSHCGQPVTLVYAPSDDYEKSAWTCPYEKCRTYHRFELKGTIQTALASCAGPFESDRTH